MPMLLGAAPLAGDDDAYLALRAFDQRIATVGERLAVSGGPLCAVKVPRTGIVVHDLSNYAKAAQADAGHAFGLGSAPQVLAVAGGSAAAAVDVRPGDALESIDGTPPPPVRAPYGSAQRSDAVLDQLDRAAADGSIVLGLRRGDARVVKTVVPKLGCATRFQQRPSMETQSGADGRLVTIDSGMVVLAGNDDELAALIAHELAHNILRHQERLGAAGASMGLLASFGRSGRLIRITENEADRLSVYLMDRADYSLDAITPFWRKLAKSGPLLGAPTHGSIDSRIATMTGERTRIAAMKARGETPTPAFSTSGTAPIR